MSFRMIVAVSFAALAMSLSQSNTTVSPPALTVDQIVSRNIEARGGLQAWRAVQTLSLSGKLDAGGNQPLGTNASKMKTEHGDVAVNQRPAEQVQLPFRLELARGRKSRLEIDFHGQTAVQVYDGTQGWKLRPYLNRHDVEPYSAEEIGAAAKQADLDGPLVDYAAKGTKIELDGTEKVEGQDCYRLKLTLKNGQTERVWISAQTFLETKIDGTPRRLDAKYHNVEIYYRDYRKVDGLMIPFLTESKVQGVKQTEKIVVDKAVVNPKFSPDQFAKPK